MAKGYWVARGDVRDVEAYKEYIAANASPIAKHGGRFLVRGGAVTPQEGDWDPQRVVVLEFADMAAARRWYDSPEYQALLPLRERAATSRLIFVEG